MITPGYIDLIANRWQPFPYVFSVPGYDLTAATFKLQVRAYPDAPTALVTLTNAMPGSEGISATVEEEDDVPTTAITLLIAETTLESLPFTNPRGEDPELAYDLVIEGAGFAKGRWVEGKFIVHGGSTQT